MSTATTNQPVANTLSAAARPAPGFLLSPIADLLFVANIAWPLVVWFTMSYGGTVANQALGFLLVYFVILPHRWITLPLVFLDKSKFQQRPRAFVGILAVVVATICAVQLTMATLALLVALDYIWNAWHFAAQHSGIHRIYGRLARPEQQTSGMLEKVLLRTFVVYTIVRLLEMFVPQDSRPWLDGLEFVVQGLHWCDWVMLALPVSMLLRELVHFRRRSIGCCAYFVSLYGLYSTMLLALHFGNRPLAVGCGAAATLFHSSEYLGIVTWHAKNRLQKTGIFRHLVPRWGVALLAFMAFFVFSAYLLDIEGTRKAVSHKMVVASSTLSDVAGVTTKEKVLRLWIMINMVVSFLHYAYDGMIWKKPKKRAQ